MERPQVIHSLIAANIFFRCYYYKPYHAILDELRKSKEVEKNSSKPYNHTIRCWHLGTLWLQKNCYEFVSSFYFYQTTFKFSQVVRSIESSKLSPIEIGLLIDRQPYVTVGIWAHCGSRRIIIFFFFSIYTQSINQPTIKKLYGIVQNESSRYCTPYRQPYVCGITISHELSNIHTDRDTTTKTVNYLIIKNCSSSQSWEKLRHFMDRSNKDHYNFVFEIF